MKLLGRQFGDELESADDRANAEPSCSATIEFSAGAIGALTATVHRSLSTEDRGGVVIELSMRDYGGAFVPHAVNTPTGVEIHLAGDVESDALIRVLFKLLAGESEFVIRERLDTLLSRR